VGKTVFTNVIAELLGGYSEPNITNLDHVVGRHNDIIQGKVLIVLNELGKAKAGTKDPSEKVRSLITENLATVGQKYKATTVSANVSNFMICTNDPTPVRMAVDDRRYCVIAVSDKRQKDTVFFGQLATLIKNPDFYPLMHQFFLAQHLQQFEASDIPMTTAKAQMVLRVMDTFDKMVLENYHDLCNGVRRDDLYDHAPFKMNKNQFTIRVRECMVSVRGGINGCDEIMKLTPGCVIRFEKIYWALLARPDEKK
jgi:hypothetical protein